MKKVLPPYSKGVNRKTKMLNYPIWREMNKKIVIYTLGGCGDMIQACQVAYWVKRKYPIDGYSNVEIICLARDETYEPIKLLFGDQFKIYQHESKEKWGEDYLLITNSNLLREIKEKYEVYVIAPDLLFRAGEYSFNFQKYNCSPQQIVQTRLLTHKYQPEKIVYCAFANTTTKNYNYNGIKELIKCLSAALTDYKFYMPVLLTWNNEKTLDCDKNVELSNLPSNVLVDYSPSWERALSFMSKSCYVITLDSAPFHLSYQYGSNRLCLDPRFGYQGNQCLWHSRWRNIGLHDSVNINTSPEIVCELVKLNLKIPQTTLLPKWFVLNNLNANWEQMLGFKF